MKKYSEKYIDKYKILQNAVIGFEFEAFFNTSYYKTLENLNQELAPVKVWGFKTYHSGHEVDNMSWSLERDLSGGVNMCELITGTMDYYSAKYYLVKVLKFIQKYGYTTDKSSIHVNLSFGDKDIAKVNTLKLILDIDEDNIYKSFPSRKNNIYAKSIKNMIPFKDYNFSDISIDTIKNTLKYPDQKYFGINFQHLIHEEDKKRLEFRYLGGANYESKIGDIQDIMDDFIIKTYNSIGAGFTEQDTVKITDYLNTKINMFKTFETYDKFLVEFPKIILQIDQECTYEIINAVYPKIQKKLYEFFESVENLSDNTIINFYTALQRVEIVNSSFKTNYKLNNYNFINCNIIDGIFDGCMFNKNKISGSHIQNSKLYNTDIKNSKIFNCDADVSTLENCYFENGFLNSKMVGGILRSGKIGLYADISDTTEVINDATDNFFQTKIDMEDKKNGKFEKK
jgi:hypothetical protein